MVASRQMPSAIAFQSRQTGTIGLCDGKLWGVQTHGTLYRWGGKGACPAFVVIGTGYCIEEGILAQGSTLVEFAFARRIERCLCTVNLVRQACFWGPCCLRPCSPPKTPPPTWS